MPKVNVINLKRRLVRRNKTAKGFAIPPKQPEPRAIERQYEASLKAYVARLNELIRKILIPQLPDLERQAYHTVPDTAVQRADSMPAEYVKLISRVKIQLSSQYTQPELDRIIAKASGATAEFSKAAFKKQMKRVTGLDLFTSEPWLGNSLGSFMVKNQDLIKSVADDQIKKVNQIVLNGFQNGLRHEAIAEILDEKLDLAEGRASAIARDQVSKLNSELTRLRQSELGIKRYIWSTSLDERVRDSHRANEGKVFSWDDPPAETGHPGEDINCRCVALPVVEDLLEFENAV